MNIPLVNAYRIFEDCKKKVTKACVNTVNVQAALARKNAIQNIKNEFTLRNNFTERNVIYTQCPISTKDINQIQSEIGAKEKISYMKRQEEGGTRKPNSGSKLAIPSTLARGGSNAKKVPQRLYLNKMKTVTGAITNPRATTTKSRMVARAFVASSKKLFMSENKTLFQVTNFKKRGDSISFKRTPIYNLKFSQTQTPKKEWLQPATVKPMLDGQNIFNQQMDKIFIGG